MKINFSSKNRDIYCCDPKYFELAHTLTTQSIAFEGEIYDGVDEIMPLYYKSKSLQGTMTIYSPELCEIFDTPTGIVDAKNKEFHLVYDGHHLVHFNSEDRNACIDQNIINMANSLCPNARIVGRSPMYTHSMIVLYNMVSYIGKKLHIPIDIITYMKYTVDKEKMIIELDSLVNFKNICLEHLILQSTIAKSFARSFGAVEVHLNENNEINENDEGNVIKHKNEMLILYDSNKITFLIRMLRYIENKVQQLNQYIQYIKRIFEIF